MATKRAQITEETAGRMYGDVLDRLADRKPSRQSNSKAAEKQVAQTAEQQAATTLEQPRVKATFYLSREDVLVIDKLQSNVFMETGKKPERSQIVSQAIQMLAGKDTA